MLDRQERPAADGSFPGQNREKRTFSRSPTAIAEDILEA
jgi:hypothetical protein